LEVSFLPTFPLKSPTTFSCSTSDQLHPLVPHKSYPLYCRFYPQCNYIQNDITQQPPSVMYNIISLINFTLLIADMIPLCMKKSLHK
jgi:hypothetical protein